MASERKSNLIPILIIGVFFFIFGFVTWLNSILVPYFKIACELTNFQAMLVAFAFYISYTVMALPASWVLKKTGFKKGMMVGLFVMAAGALIFIPAAMVREYGLFLTGLFVLGIGLTFLQTASNPYITILGPQETAARRISIMGVCNKVAGAIAPVLLAYFILNDGDEFVKNLSGMTEDAKRVALDGLSRRVIAPYSVMAVVLVLLGLLVRFSPLPEIEEEEETEEQRQDADRRKTIFAFPHLIWGVIALFFYVGVEVIAGDTIIRYAQTQGIAMADAKMYTSYTLFMMLAGYFLGIVLIPKVISQRMALMYSAILGLLFSLIAVFTKGELSVLFIALLGIANALVWPAIWPLAIHGLGRFMKTGSALLIMAIAGGALLPPLWGYFADLYPQQMPLTYMLCIPCYLVILSYAVIGYRLKPRNK